MHARGIISIGMRMAAIIMMMEPPSKDPHDDNGGDDDGHDCDRNAGANDHQVQSATSS